MSIPKNKRALKKSNGTTQKIIFANRTIDMDESRGMKIAKLAFEISLIDDILEDGVAETLKHFFEEDRDIILSYQGKSEEFILDKREKLENQLAKL